MVSKAEVVMLMRDARKHASECKKKKAKYSKVYKILSIILSVLSSIQAAISTYSIFSDSTGKKYIGMLISILVATASAYISLAEFPESIATYEVSASVYTHICSFLKKIYHNYDNQTPIENAIAVEYCQSTAAFLECIDLDDSSSGSKSLIELYHKETVNPCDQAGYQYLETYKYTINEYSGQQYTHLYAGNNGKLIFCEQHGDVLNSSTMFNGVVPQDAVLFKTSISDTGTYEKKYVICERNDAKILAVFVPRSAWESADMDLANESIQKCQNILDSDLFNTSISEANVEVIIDKPEDRLLAHTF